MHLNGNTFSGTNYYGYNNTQTQMQDYTQLQKQKQDLVHCNNSFGMLLSSMESLFIKSNYNISVLFGHYNHFNDISWKTKDQIKSQVYTDLMAYKIQKLAYKQKYGKFDYPDFPPIEEVIGIVEKWKKMAKERDEIKLCDEILDLINDTNEKPISYYQGRVQSTRTFSNADPVECLQFSNKIHDKIDFRNQSINNEIYRNPGTKYGLEIGKKPGTSEFSSLRRNIDVKPKEQQQIIEEKAIESKVNTLIGKYQAFFQYSTTNYEERDFDKLLVDVENKISKYADKYKDLDFLKSRIHIDNEIKKVKNCAKYVQNPDKQLLIHKINNLFETIKSYACMN